MIFWGENFEMSLYTLENDFLKVIVSSIGAELQSIFSKDTNCEYIWQPVEGIWGRHSMILFPNAGRIADNYVIIGDTKYPARMHGFAYEKKFDLLHKDSNSVVLGIHDDSETLETFPYKFKFEVIFRLEKQSLIEEFRVINKDANDIYFSLGAHPGFRCPILENENSEDYCLLFDSPQNIGILEYTPDKRLLTGKKIPWLTESKEIHLCDNFFDNGPILAGGMAADSIMLYSEKSGRYIKMGVKDFEYLCLWGNERKMSIICIEPWCGTSDYANTNHVWETKVGIQKLKSKDIFVRKLEFSVG